jgi:hypothetical protein
MSSCSGPNGDWDRRFKEAHPEHPGLGFALIDNPITPGTAHLCVEDGDVAGAIETAKAIAATLLRRAG